MMELNLVLAGPILRRVEPTKACIWLATSAPIRARALIFEHNEDGSAAARPIGTGESESVQLGPRLFVHLLVAVPGGDTFPIDRLLEYDVEVVEERTGRAFALEDLGLLAGPDRVAYRDLRRPSFYIRAPSSPQLILHGSCRMLHGKGEDALAAADDDVARHARDLTRRPVALYLTGDQIYGDQVAGPLMAHIRRLATQVVGADDDSSVPGIPPLSDIPIYGRKRLALENAGLTSSHSQNHLMTFGEYAAMYLVAWNEQNWPETFPVVSRAIGPQRRAPRPADLPKRRKYAAELKDLKRARRALPAVRRVLANIPTYMIFDDHDVTDDWNLTLEWRTKVRDRPAGRRVIANALGAYWAFQGWGNDPDAFDDEFKKTIADRPTRREATDASAFEDAMWSFDRWSFHVPTDPPTMFVDTRTQRDYDSPEGAARLLGQAGQELVMDTARGAGHRSGRPLIFVSPVPLYGLELQERRQKFLKDKVGPYEIDLEAWHSNLHGFVDLMKLLIDRLELPFAVFLSGDVHYGMNLKVVFSIEDRALPVTQLVSSSLKHSGVFSKSALNLLGKMIRTTHERVGWHRPPTSADAGPVKKRFVLRPTNTDEWADDAPLFLAPQRAAGFNITEPPDYREQREYVWASGPRRLKIVGDNNVGRVSIDGDRVTHELLCPTQDGLMIYSAAIETPARTPLTDEKRLPHER
jgi:hypothetical protein